MQKSIFISLILSCLFACNSSEENEPGLVFQRKIEAMEMESFKIPDSVNTSFIIATYYDDEALAQTVLVYENEAKTSVKKIDYLKDSTVSVDALQVLKMNEFRSARFNVDYVVDQHSVNRIHVRELGKHPMPRSKEYRRTDRD